MKPQQDVEDVKFVINFDYPQSSEDYIHRIGRTGRSQQSGTSYAFFTSSNMRHASDLISVLRESNQEVSPQLLEMADLAKAEMLQIRNKKALKNNAGYRYLSAVPQDRKPFLKGGFPQPIKQNGIRDARRGPFRYKNGANNQRIQPNMRQPNYQINSNENQRKFPQEMCNYSFPPPQQNYNKQMDSFGQFNSKIPPPGYNSMGPSQFVQYPTTY